MSDMVKRLRAYEKDRYGWHNIGNTCEEAADEIERLNAEIARLREALVEIADLEGYKRKFPGKFVAFERCLEIARKALAKHGEK